MKLKIIILAFSIGILGGCSKESNTISHEDMLSGRWNLKSLSAGFVGLDENYPDGVITWTFDDKNKTIVVENNVPLSSSFIYDSGTHNYSVIEINHQKYLMIDNNEYGGLTISNNTLTIDQNILSYGVGADGFILYFEK